jgi:hypothetical protein
MTMVSLVVMEPGSQWPDHVRDSEDVVAFGSDQDGLPRRTRQALDSIERRGHQVRIAVFACNGAADRASVAARAEVIDDLLTAVSRVAFGRLVLTSAGGASMHLRRELLSLVGASTQKLRGTTTTVSVRFGGATGGDLDLKRRSLGGADGSPGLGLPVDGRR